MIILRLIACSKLYRTFASALLRQAASPSCTRKNSANCSVKGVEGGGARDTCIAIVTLSPPLFLNLLTAKHELVAMLYHGHLYVLVSQGVNTKQGDMSRTECGRRYS